MQGQSTHNINAKESWNESERAGGISQPVSDDEVVSEEETVIEEEGVTADEGYQSAVDCTTCKKCLVKIEESYKQQIAALKLELQHQRNFIDKYYHIKNELTNDEQNFLRGKERVVKDI